MSHELSDVQTIYKRQRNQRPYDIEFREDLPKTLVGKVAYRVLEEEELGKLAAQNSSEKEG